ncbi:MAG: hypothetical protein IKI63_01660 [Clostridia bacterium]|nr:hypothetical protein [Clostridia bacterium]
MNNPKTVPAGRMLALILCLCMVLCLTAACGDDRPPAEDSPAPAPHDGVFLSDYGTLTFHGDGKTVQLKVTPAFSTLSGLPAGEYEATYVFLLQNKEWRYDQAETVRFTVEGQSYSFPLAISPTQDDIIALLMPGDITATFIKA